MNMRSSNLLPFLQELPRGEAGRHRTFREHITDLVNSDRAMYAAEFASAVSFGMWYVFGERIVSHIQVPDNMPDTTISQGEILQLAYEQRLPGEATQYPDVHDRYQELLESGGDTGWFCGDLKGQMAEFNAMALREQQGHMSVSLADSATKKGWDFSSVSPDEQPIFNQVKFGDSHSYSEFYRHMTDNPDVTAYWVSGGRSYDDAVRAAEAIQDGVERHVSINKDAGLGELVDDALKNPANLDAAYPYDVGSQIYNMSADSSMIDYPFDSDSDFLLVEGTTDGLNTLSGNMGMDIPDGVVDLIPYAGAIFAASRLVMSVLKTEREFKAADRTTKNKIQVVQTLTLMSRMGITTVCAVGGGAAGGLAGSFLPGVGNLIGGIGGSIFGGGIGMYLNKNLQPHMLNLALDIAGLTNDDLFYYKNKPRIDTVALNFQTTARELVAVPA